MLTSTDGLSLWPYSVHNKQNSTFMRLKPTDAGVSSQVSALCSTMIRLVLKAELLFLYFLTLNRFGYGVYCYLCCVFVFGRKIPNPDIYEQLVVLIATLIVFDVISCAVLFFVVLRFKRGQDFIYHYVPKSYVVSCIGNPGKKTIVKALGAALFVYLMVACACLLAGR